MFKRSTLLKVMSIILIVLGAFSVIGSIMLFAMGDALQQSYEMMGIEAPSMFSNILSAVGSLILLGAGIMGIVSKSKKTLLIIGCILCAYYLVSVIYSTVTTGFAALNFVGLIVPILYMWGWYQTDENKSVR